MFIFKWFQKASTIVHAGENIPKYLLNSEIILNSDFWSEMTGKQSLPVSSRDATKKY